MDRPEKKCRNGARERTRFRARFSNADAGRGRGGDGGRGRRRKHGGRTDVCTTWRGGTCRRRRKWGVSPLPPPLPLPLNSPFVRSYVVSSRWLVCSRCFTFIRFPAAWRAREARMREGARVSDRLFLIRTIIRTIILPCAKLNGGINAIDVANANDRRSSCISIC